MSTLPITPIHTNNAPAAIGPFSQACIAGDFLFISGQGGISPESGKVAGSSLESQAEQLMQNLKAILEQAGTDFSRVVKATCFLADMDTFLHLTPSTQNISHQSPPVAVSRSRLYRWAFCVKSKPSSI